MNDAIDRYLASYWWWRRVLGASRPEPPAGAGAAARIVAALDDPNRAVRNSGSRALSADLADPTTLPAVVVRLHDSSVDRGRVCWRQSRRLDPRANPFF
jgi:hypothetical protein